MEDSYQTRIEKAKKAIEEAEYILLGGGAGLSAAVGITYSGKRFTENFAPFIKKYGLTDMYSSAIYPFRTQEERWGFWAKHISLNRYETGPTKLYKDLYRLVKDKKYFVITSNVESQFEKAGFPFYKVFEIEGNYGYLHCAKGCHDKLYNNERLVKDMVEKTVDCKIPSELVPKCPVCGGEMVPNLRINQYDFAQDEKWYELEALYKDFVMDSVGSKRVFMELGVENATLVRLKKDHPESFEENEVITIAFTEDMQEVVSALMK